MKIANLDKYTVPDLCMVELTDNCGLAYIDVNHIVEIEVYNGEPSQLLGGQPTKRFYRIALDTEPRTQLIINAESYVRIVTAFQKAKEAKKPIDAERLKMVESIYEQHKKL